MLHDGLGQFHRVGHGQRLAQRAGQVAERILTLLEPPQELEQLLAIAQRGPEGVERILIEALDVEEVRRAVEQRQGLLVEGHLPDVTGGAVDADHRPARHRRGEGDADRQAKFPAGRLDDGAVGVGDQAESLETFEERLARHGAVEGRQPVGGEEFAALGQVVEGLLVFGGEAGRRRGGRIASADRRDDGEEERTDEDATGRLHGTPPSWM